jgi:hypothetical protein
MAEKWIPLALKQEPKQDLIAPLLFEAPKDLSPAASME